MVLRSSNFNSICHYLVTLLDKIVISTVQDGSGRMASSLEVMQHGVTMTTKQSLSPNIMIHDDVT